MDFLMAFAKPTGFWFNIIFGVESILGDYVLAIILITIAIKLILIPVDLVNKVITKANTNKQAQLKPEVDKLKKQYANNPQMLNQKTMELYKRENFSLSGTCVTMLVYMAITVTIFITLLSAFNKIAAWKIGVEYEQMKIAYETTYEENVVNPENEDSVAFATEQAQIAVVDKYGEIKTGFLWIQNIWRPDTSASIVLSYKDFVSLTKNYDKNIDVQKEEYEKIVTQSFSKEYAQKYNGWNGFFLLSILSAVLTYGSIKVTSIISKRKALKQGKVFTEQPDASKGMTLIMPLVMGVFTLLYNSAFGIYIVAGAIISFITGPIVSIVVDEINYRVEEKARQKKLVSYDRKKRED